MPDPQDPNVSEEEIQRKIRALSGRQASEGEVSRMREFLRGMVSGATLGASETEIGRGAADGATLGATGYGREDEGRNPKDLRGALQDFYDRNPADIPVPPPEPREPPASPMPSPEPPAPEGPSEEDIARAEERLSRITGTDPSPEQVARFLSEYPIEDEGRVDPAPPPTNRDALMRSLGRYGGDITEREVIQEAHAEMLRRSGQMVTDEELQRWLAMPE